MKIQVRGVTYESVKEAAAALNVSYHSVYTALDRGALEMLGLGKTKAKPVTLEGITFRSMTAASLALGLNRTYLQWAFKSGGAASRERVAFAAIRYKARLEMEQIRAESDKPSDT